MDIKNFNWGTGIFFIAYHLLLLAALPFYFIYTPPALSMIIATVILVYLSGMSITAGYHRFYAHRTYTPHKIVEAVMLFFATMTAQTSALRWACDHRMHHGHTDQKGDPHAINKGFWYAHIFWLFEKPERFDPKVVPGLMKNKLLRFQDRYYGILFLATNIIVWLFVGWLLNDYIGAFLLAWWTRLFLVHHFTFFINSLAHTWGSRTFSNEESAVDNFIIAFLTFGEGYHNYHHVFAGDYRNGVRWYHFDPTKWLIWTLGKIGLAKGARRMNTHTIKKRLVLEDKSILLAKIREIMYVKKEALEQKVHQLSGRITSKVSQINKLAKQYKALKQNRAKRDRLVRMRLKIKTIKRSFHKDWNSWLKLSSNIMRLKPQLV